MPDPRVIWTGSQTYGGFAVLSFFDFQGRLVVPPVVTAETTVTLFALMVNQQQPAVYINSAPWAEDALGNRLPYQYILENPLADSAFLMVENWPASGGGTIVTDCTVFLGGLQGITLGCMMATTPARSTNLELVTDYSGNYAAPWTNAHVALLERPWDYLQAAGMRGSGYTAAPTQTNADWTPAITGNVTLDFNSFGGGILGTSVYYASGSIDTFTGTPRSTPSTPNWLQPASHDWKAYGVQPIYLPQTLFQRAVHLQSHIGPSSSLNWHHVLGLV